MKLPIKAVNWVLALGLISSSVVLGMASCAVNVSDTGDDGAGAADSKAGEGAALEDPETAEAAEALSDDGGAGTSNGCADGIKNNTETDIDCGGTTCPKCDTAKVCVVAADCASGKCTAGLCAAPTCSDGIKNGNESAKDCGGSCATKCLIGATCSINADCFAVNCYLGVCMPAGWQCTDGIKNGSETAIDCGGTNCATRCANGKTCLANSDCAGGTCTAGVCGAAVVSCSDLIKNGTETDVDCGGSCATKCANGKGCLAAADCTSGACTGGLCTALPTCSDGVKNGTETDVDCGGTCATKCALGKLCVGNADCSSTNCSAGVCAAPLPTCTDGVKNGTETDVDCGGSCITKCANGKTCGIGGDCTSTSCVAGLCAALPTCTDGLKNGTETDIDCGGSCATKCNNGQTCTAGADCTSTSCVAGLCTALPTCTDAIKNGTETDVDCGGSCATKCALGKLCAGNVDCSSTNCSAGVCAAPLPTCTDGLKNGTETDVDCGGSCAAKCANGKTCGVGGDCTSTSCVAGLCTALPTCTDGVKNGTETDVDCGGSCATKCANGKTCGIGGDCTSTSCVAGLCTALPTCTDGLKNGTETDVDCGGSCATKCANGKTCAGNVDCTSTNCSAGVCAAPLPTCTDGIKNGSESDVDCGGSCATKCANGKTCGIGGDCSSTSCVAGLCTALPTCTDGIKNGTESDVDCGGSCATKCANGKTCGIGGDCTSTNCSAGVCAAPLPTCTDGIKNGTESDVDCGGSCATKCANGKTCGIGGDCTSTSCVGGLCTALPTCTDGVKNGTESDVDCGGSCATKCANGKTCGVGGDCSSATCTGGLCVAPSGTCSDGIKNGTETAKDCGGSCATKCLIGATCLINADCLAANCYVGVCMPSGWQCTDGIKNGSETAIDCGGTNCVTRCANGKTCVANSDCSGGTCTGGVCGAAAVSCSDGIKNGTETDVDCGGSCATKCANGKTCVAGTDCSSTSCTGGLCTALPTCSDGVKNGTETDVDCGGSCATKCAVGKLCAANIDCSSTNCSAGVCAAPLPTCTDGLKNGTETDVDCGGSCAAKCANGKTCGIGADCTSTSCTGGLCTALPTCSDGVKNGTESDVDCGGSCAAKCANGKTCVAGADCTSTSCVAGLCTALPTCSDGVKNGTESDIDCGGSCATKCANGKTCGVGGDCTSTSCTGGLCTALPTCSDAIKNGTETDVDCGGSCATKCANGKLCSANGDCTSVNCAGGVCAAPAPTCTDAIKNGSETDVDCGGLVCVKCSNGKACTAAGDCTSGNCSAGLCAAPLPTCTDGVKNGTETDVDCGGSCAAKCNNGQTCTTGTDCTSTSCVGGLCTALPTCTDGLKNGTESDVDCGGSCAAKCANGKFCSANGDCTSVNCAGGVCAAPAPTCTDLLKNGSETDVDCGGLVCVKCSLGKACVAAGDCTSGNCSAGLCAAPLPTCTDGVKNGTESDVDCGGSCATKCANGKTCGIGGDCTSTSCVAGLCTALPTCTDGAKNGTETDVDCGGSCATKCANGKFCSANGDCTSVNCAGGVCAAPAPTCTDLLKNGSETDVDCGGLVCVKCGNGKACGSSADCVSGTCTAGLCAAAAVGCADGLKNGAETDVDCGGGTCPSCANGKVCGSAVDCASASCASGVCAAIVPTCTDGAKNGAETDVDCGGSTCGKCANGKACVANGDCLSAGCVGGVCSVVAATCTDGLKNGLESDVDCGGGSCPKCPIGGACVSATSCVLVGGFAQCQNNTCIVPNAPCGNGVKDGTETDIDCGGSACGKCKNGWICVAGTDCKSGSCTGGICAAASPTCVDGIKNGTETDTDCGGTVCPKCVSGQTCSNAGDCVTASCAGNACGPVGMATTLWSKRFGNATDQECDVVRTNAAEDVFMANYITGVVDYGTGAVGSGEYISLAKLSPAGNTLWGKAYPNGTKQYPNGLGVNALDNLFLAGSYFFTLKFGTPVAPIASLGSDDLYAASFSGLGGSLWAKSFGDANQFQQFNGLAIDPQGNPVMTGWLTGNANFGGGVLNGNNVDIVVVKLDKSGSHLWSRAYGNGSLQGGHSVAVDGSGNVIVAGYLNGSVNFGGGAVGPAGSSIFLLKLDANGNYVWAKTFASTQNELRSHRVAVDAAGNIYLGGGKLGTINFGGGALATTSGVGIYDAYLAKFDANGNHVWSKNYGDGQEQWVDEIAVDKSGNLVATGSFMGTINFGGGSMTSLGGNEFGGDVFVTKVSAANGTQLFAARYGDASKQEPKSLTVDASGNVVLCGLFQGTINFGSGSLTSAGGNDIFVTKMALP